MHYPAHLLGASTHELLDQQSLSIARAALDGVGDPDLGEWTERGKPGPTGKPIWHIRRRLSAREQIMHSMVVRDIRNTSIGIERVRKLIIQFPALKPLAIRIGEYPQSSRANAI